MVYKNIRAQTIRILLKKDNNFSSVTLIEAKLTPVAQTLTIFFQVE